MINKKTIKLSLAAMVVSSMLMAQDFTPSAAASFDTTSSPEVEQIVVMADDVQRPSAFEDANTQAENWVRTMGMKHPKIQSELSSGWIDELDAYISIGTAEFSVEDPTKDKSFTTKRNLKSVSAILNAKADIIEYIESDMSAEDKVEVPGTDLNKKFNEEKEALIAKLQEKSQKLDLYKKYLDKKEIDMLDGVGYADYSKAFYAALIKKLDDKFDAKEIEEKKKKEYEEAKVAYNKINDDFNSLKSRITNITQNSTEKASSKVASVSKMPLFGTTALAQFESYDAENKIFQISTVVIWSAKMEKAARMLVQGIDYKVPTSQTKTISQWINENDWSSAVGIRKFTDKDGLTHFVGIAASPVRGKSSSARRKAKGVSELMAKKNAIMSVFADVEAQKAAEEVMETYSDGEDYEESMADEAFAKNLKQGFKNRKVNGSSKRFSKILVHPISQQQMHVAIYSVDQRGAKKALELQERNYLTKMLDTKAQHKLKGRSDAFKESAKRAEEDKSDYYEEKTITTRSIDNKHRSEAAQNQTTHTANQVEVVETIQPSQAVSYTNQKPQSQSVQGGGTSDKYDW